MADDDIPAIIPAYLIECSPEVTMDARGQINSPELQAQPHIAAMLSDLLSEVGYQCARWRRYHPDPGDQDGQRMKKKLPDQSLPPSVPEPSPSDIARAVATALERFADREGNPGISHRGWAHGHTDRGAECDGVQASHSIDSRRDHRVSWLSHETKLDLLYVWLIIGGLLLMVNLIPLALETYIASPLN